LSNHSHHNHHDHHRTPTQSWGVAPFKESRDTHAFARRVGDLPQQKEGDELDYRPLLHRCARLAAWVHVGFGGWIQLQQV